MGNLYYREAASQVQQQNEVNKLIIDTFRKEIEHIQNQSSWCLILLQQLKQSNPQSLFIYQYSQDLVKFRRENDSFYKSSSITNVQQVEQQLQKSFLIPEDEEAKRKSVINLNNQINASINDQSFIGRLQKNQSLVMQMDIIFKNQFAEEYKFNNSLKHFLKWTEMTQKHLQDGFLKPIYIKFAKILKNEIKSNTSKKLQYILDNLNEQTTKFIQIMINVYYKVYKLQLIKKQENGDLFNHENLHNFVLNNFFKINDDFILELKDIIHSKLESKIQKFRQKIAKLKQKNLDFFEIPEQFIPKSENDQIIIYQKCIHKLEEISNAKTPIGKLKIIIQAAKEIVLQLKKYYELIHKQQPNLDPDSINSIVMYIITNAGDPQLLIELQIIERFSTNNCLNCISGYYLNVFKATIQYVIEEVIV